MMNKVNIDLSVIMQLTDPPESVQTVNEYRDYIRDLLSGDARQPKRPVGRPPKAAGISKPGYTGDELAAIDRYLKQDIENNREAYISASAKLAKGLSDNQTGDELEFSLDNGLVAYFAERPSFENGTASVNFPPVIDNH